MSIVREFPFTLNGVKSSIECIDRYESRNINTSLIYNYHDDIEILYALDTDSYLIINDEKFRFCTGDLAIINSNDLHSLSCFKDSHYIVVKMSPEILYSEANSVFELNYLLPFIRENSYRRIFNSTAFESIDIATLFREIMSEWEEKKTAYELVIRSNLLKLFSEVFRYWSKHQILQSEVDISSTIKDALVYISENLDTVTEKSVADYCGYSYNHFSYAFKNAMGKNFKDYLTSLKLNEATKKLVSTTESVTEIATSTGFSSASHFISNFKKHKGITPHQFRLKYAKMPQFRYE